MSIRAEKAREPQLVCDDIAESVGPFAQHLESFIVDGGDAQRWLFLFLPDNDGLTNAENPRGIGEELAKRFGFRERQPPGPRREALDLATKPLVVAAQISEQAGDD